MQPILGFNMHLPERSQADLVLGTLVLKTREDEVGKKFEATSGSRSNQCRNSWTLKGRGPIPPTSSIRETDWVVSTQRLSFPHVKGIEGSFYAISPFMVNLGSVKRGDFGIHFDANVPGSQGCIVIPNQKHWDIFRESMLVLRVEGFQQMRLHVSYT